MVFAAWRRWRDQRVITQRPIPEPMWSGVLARYPFLNALPPHEAQRLRDMATLFLARKEFSTAGGLTLTDEMAVAVAAQACLPILQLGLAWYDGFISIVMHPDEVVARREFVDDDGVVHEYDEALVGEAPGAGPMVLTWSGVAHAGTDVEPAYNVVIHEFAHVLELHSGEAGGIPPLPSPAAREHWRQVLEASQLRFQRRLDAGLPTVLDPYGAESLSEYYAVACEGFFVTPIALHDDDPYLYALLKGFFRQDPATRLQTAGPTRP